MRQLIAGNWKMNLLRADGRALASDLTERLAARPLGVDLAVCPPFPLLASVGAALGPDIALGAQDCHTAESGAHTGDVAAPMLADIGCRYVIVGHSERRADHGEDDALVKAKATAACAAGLFPIVCVGESLDDRDAGRAEAVVEAQLRGSLPDGAAAETVVVAYEPVWAIGTGRTPTADDIAAMHAMIRRVVAEMTGGQVLRTLYGGSVKPGNAAEILATDGVDGALVGGASLKADDFWGIASAAPAE